MPSAARHRFTDVATADVTDEYRCPCGVRQRWRRTAHGVVYEVFEYGDPGRWVAGGSLAPCRGHAKPRRAKRLPLSQAQAPCTGVGSYPSTPQPPRCRDLRLKPPPAPDRRLSYVGSEAAREGMLRWRRLALRGLRASAPVAPMPLELHLELVPQLWSRGRSDAR